MERTVEVGEIIFVKDENKVMIVTDVLSKEIRDSGKVGFDFMAENTSPEGVSRDHLLYANRGFKLDGDNWESCFNN